MELPQSPTNFSASPTGLLAEMSQLIEEARSVYSQLVDRISPENANFINTILPIAHVENKLVSAKKLFGFYNSISTSEELRETSGRTWLLFSTFESGTLMRDDLFRLVDNVVRNQKTENLSFEDAHYLKNKHQSFLRNGLGIQSAGQRDRYAQIQALLREKTLEAQRCINKSNGLWLSADELKGFPSSSLSALKRSEGENDIKLWFPLTRANIARALQFVEEESTRRKVYVANDNRCLENVARLKEIILLRDESARLLGYSSFMDLSILDKLANSVDLIKDYVSELHNTLRTAGRREIELLLELKKKDQQTNSNVSPITDTNFYLWDYNFYKTILTKTTTKFDEQRFSEYFSLEQTLMGIIEVYSSLFGLHFVEISKKLAFSSWQRLWHDMA